MQELIYAAAIMAFIIGLALLSINKEKEGTNALVAMVIIVIIGGVLGL